MLWLKALVFIIRGNSTAHLNRACSLQKHSITSTVNTGTHRHTKWRCLSFSRPYKHSKKTKILIVFKNVTQDRYTHYSWSISQHFSKIETMGMWLKIFPFRKTRKKIFIMKLNERGEQLAHVLYLWGWGLDSHLCPEYIEFACSPLGVFFSYSDFLPQSEDICTLVGCLGFPVPLCPETPELGCRFPLTLCMIISAKNICIE